VIEELAKLERRIEEKDQIIEWFRNQDEVRDLKKWQW
jgi:hypothetical protein